MVPPAGQNGHRSPSDPRGRRRAFVVQYCFCPQCGAAALNVVFQPVLGGKAGDGDSEDIGWEVQAN